MASQWYYRRDTTDVGPVSFQNLARLLSKGRIEETTDVRRADAIEWSPVHAVVGLERAARKLSDVEPGSARPALQERRAEPAKLRHSGPGDRKPTALSAAAERILQQADVFKDPAPAATDRRGFVMWVGFGIGWAAVAGLACYRYFDDPLADKAYEQ